MKLKESRFQFSDPQIVEFHFTENTSYKREENGSQKKDSIHVIADSHVNRKKEGKRAKVYLSLHIGEADNRVSPYFIYIKMVSDFFWHDISEHEAEGFLKVSAPALLYSYMRPYIAMVTNAANYTPLNLPFMNFQDSIRQAEEKI